MRTTIVIESNPIGGSKVTVTTDDGTPVVVTDRPVASNVNTNKEQGSEPARINKPAPAPQVHKHVEKNCMNCGEPFVASGTGMHKRKFCDDCKNKRDQGVALPVPKPKEVVASNDLESEPVLARPVASTMTTTDTGSEWCDWCKKWGDHITENHQGEKVVPQPAQTKECTGCGDDMPAGSMYDECASCRMKNQPPKPEPKKPGRKSKHGPVVVKRARGDFRSTQRSWEDQEKASSMIPAEKPDANFTDPWNCARCREGKGLCRFHRSMEASGSKPPKIFKY